MKKTTLLLAVAVLFSGCSSIYDIPDDKENKVTVEDTLNELEEAAKVSPEEQAELDAFYGTQTKVEYKDLMTMPGNNLYYFYQETCSHCNDLKPTILEFSKKLTGQDAVNLYLVDMRAEENEGAWASGTYNETDLEAMKTYEDIKIKGTPTMINVVDGEVKNYSLGGTQIEALLASVEEEFLK